MKYLKYIEGLVRVSENNKDANLILTNRILSVINMYDFYLNKRINANGIERISFIFEYNENESIELSNINENYVNVIAKFNFKNLFDSNILDSRKKLMNIIMKGVDEFCIEKNIEIAAFLEAYEKVKSFNYEFCNYLFPKYKKNKNRNIEANLFFCCNEVYEIYLKYKKNEEVIYKYELIGKLPLVHSSILYVFFKSISWIDEKNIKISHSNQNDYWVFNIDKNELSFYFARAENGDPHGEYDLALIYLEGKMGVLKNVEKGMFWLKKSANQNFKKAKKKLNELSNELR